MADRPKWMQAPIVRTAGDFAAGMTRGAVAGTLGMPVDVATDAANLGIAGAGYAAHKLGLVDQPPALIERPVGGSEWIAERMRGAGVLQDSPGTVADTIGHVTGSLASGYGGIKSSSRGLAHAKMTPSETRELGRSSAQIYDPKSLKQRAYSDDYPETIQSDAGSRLSVDIEGRPLTARYIAGRRMVGSSDEGIDPGGVHEIGIGIGVPTYRTSRGLGSVVGKYSRSAAPDGETTRSILIDESLGAQEAARVQAHEIGHAIDDLVYGNKIPTDGLKKELMAVFEDLNTGTWFKRGRGMTPKGLGYSGQDADRELMAEAIRAYLRDPNYLKTVAPKTAGRIREYVNANPNLNKTIQFNVAAPVGLAGILSQENQE